MRRRKYPTIKLSARKRPMFAGRSGFRGQAIKLPRPASAITSSIPPGNTPLPVVTASPRSPRAQPVRRPLRWVLVMAAAFCTSAWPVDLKTGNPTRSELWGIHKAHLAEALGAYDVPAVFPNRIDINVKEATYRSILHYSIDEGLQEAVVRLIARYKPDYSAYVAIEPQSGRVLAMHSYNNRDPALGNLAARASFPAASVFKIVTAAAAIDQGKATADTVIPYNGKSSSLYKRQVFHHKNNKWTRRVSLRTAFAKSVNTVFGRIGVAEVGAAALIDYAERFRFNSAADADFPAAMGQIKIEPGDDWSVVEAASGFTRNTTLSPLHGAMIAATVVNDGAVMQPSLVDAATDLHGIEIYLAEALPPKQIVTAETAKQLKSLMRETVKAGSARKSFRGFFKGAYAKLEVGGKTGSLTGLSPRGKNDWFVGYASDGSRSIAFAVLMVNVEKWKVKSAYVARKALENYFQPDRKS